ncbi:MAG: hypothetical protein QG650_374 [Patescibacteria group bacterium]|nr:hypothetical protein [Patescibacteria group bacterium]
MSKREGKQKAFAWFLAKNRVTNIRIPMFDPQFLRIETLSAMNDVKRKTRPTHLHLLGENAEVRVVIHRKEGDEFATAVFAMDNEAAVMLRAAGAKFVRLESWPVAARKDAATERRAEKLDALREEMGLSVQSTMFRRAFAHVPPPAPGLRSR